MDEKTECRSLYFLVSILRGIICIVIVVITHTHIILASRWRFEMHIICFMNYLLAPLSLFFREFQQNSQFLRTISNDLGRVAYNHEISSI